MRPTVPAVLALVLLAGCIGAPPRQGELVRHDLGAHAGERLPLAVPLVGLRLRAAAWLDAPAQFYRLAYADPARRQAYAASRWAAPPAELLERHLQRRLAFVAGAPGCRLALTLDELEQRFADAAHSQAVLELRASLLPRHGDGALARQAFAIRADAPTPDARGGAAATRAAADALAQDLARWLAELARERPQVVSVCQEKP